MSGQACGGTRPAKGGRLGFNGGPDNCPARHDPHSRQRWPQSQLQWRAGQLSGQAAAPPPPNAAAAALQWRAGQLSGQAHRADSQGASGLRASMEGRTIVRPGRHSGGALPPGPTCFNGGPDNCPARPAGLVGIADKNTALQWRAGQLSGQAIDLLTGDTSGDMLQWRAGQLSGQAGFSTAVSGAASRLQWRAGQLSGQARLERQPPPDRPDSFNGGPDNCPARRNDGCGARGSCESFNGGPDNCPARLHKPSDLGAQSDSGFNGGPDNCPARLARSSGQCRS